jgi:hypothetical protein
MLYKLKVHTNILTECEHRVEFLNIKAGVNRYALKGYIWIGDN